MTFGGVPFAESTFAGVGLVPVAGAPPPPAIIQHPIDVVFTVEIGGIQFSARNDSLSLDVEFGRQGSASFEILNPPGFPLIGQPVTLRFYSAILFVGAIDRVSVRSDLSHSVTVASCECTDNSYLLFRRQVKKTYTNIPLASLALSLIADELINDGVTLGLIDNYPPLPVVDADNVSVFDVLRDAAASVGAMFFIDHLKRLQFRSSTIPPAPMAIDENMAEECTLNFDRETYRNKQTVIVTGTPANENDPALSITYTMQNSNQIPQQAILESTSGTYNGIEQITHPTSNTTVDLMKLGLAYAKILLGLRGSIRETLTVKTRQYGFLVGQIATVDLPHLGVGGSWVVQRVSMQDVAGRWMSTTMELSRSTLKRRAQELWIDVVRKGKVIVLPPTAVTTQSAVIVTPGSSTTTVPAGVTLMQITCEGGGGGGGGDAYHEMDQWIGFELVKGSRLGHGVRGGSGGLAISVIDVTPGETLYLTVGSGGSGGVTDINIGISTPAVGGSGGTGGTTRVQRSGAFTVCEAYGGSGGSGGRANVLTGEAATFPKGPDGSGLGDVVTVGGGREGGLGGVAETGTNGIAGQSGRLTLAW